MAGGGDGVLEIKFTRALYSEQYLKGILKTKGVVYLGQSPVSTSKGS
jgi:hypothetical protein